MSAIHGKNTSVLVNQFDLSRALRKHDAQRQANELECTTYQATAREYVTDLPDGTLSLEGFYRSDPVEQDQITDVFNSLIETDTPNVVTIAPEGASAVGKRALLQSAVQTRAEAQSAATGLLQSMASFRGGFQHGVVLAPVQAYSATGNGASVDNGAATENGGVGHLHIPAVAGTDPEAVWKIQHSADDSTWADLITFATATEATYERVEVVGTVEQYLRAIRTISGTGAEFTAGVAFARF